MVVFCHLEEVILNEEKTTEEEKLKIIEGNFIEGNKFVSSMYAGNKFFCNL